MSGLKLVPSCVVLHGGKQVTEGDPTNRALIASDGSNGCVLHYVGAALSFEIEEGGFRQLVDLGLDDAPEGLSVWEGTGTWEQGGYECPEEGEVVFRGSFRELNAVEWAALRDGECPWPPARGEYVYEEPEPEPGT